MKDFILVHDSQSLGNEMILNINTCKMICKAVPSGQALIRISDDPRMPGILCTETYDEIKKKLGYAETK